MTGFECQQTGTARAFIQGNSVMLGYKIWFASTVCLAGLLTNVHAEDVFTLSGKIAPGLHWKSSPNLPGNAVPFITIKSYNGSLGTSTTTHYVVRAKFDGEWRLGSVSTAYVPVDRGGGGGATQDIAEAKICGKGNGKAVRVSPFEYLVADADRKDQFFSWFRVEAKKCKNAFSAACLVPPNAIAVGHGTYGIFKGKPVVPGRMPTERKFGEVSPGVRVLFQAEFVAWTDDGWIDDGQVLFQDAEFVEFLVAEQVKSDAVP